MKDRGRQSPRTVSALSQNPLVLRTELATKQEVRSPPSAKGNSQIAKSRYGAGSQAASIASAWVLLVLDLIVSFGLGVFFECPLFSFLANGPPAFSVLGMITFLQRRLHALVESSASLESSRGIGPCPSLPSSGETPRPASAASSTSAHESIGHGVLICFSG